QAAEPAGGRYQAHRLPGDLDGRLSRRVPGGAGRADQGGVRRRVHVHGRANAQGVRRGYVVITIDALFFGERRLILDEDRKYGWDRAGYSKADAAHLNAKCRAKEATLVKALTLAGLTWPGVVVWDDIRTVGYLASRPEVDAKRIGCL